jgi:hypothetical protein
VRVRLDEFERFFRPFLSAVPRVLKRSLRGHPIVFAARHGGGADYFLLDVADGEIAQLDPDRLPANPIVFETAAVVLKKAMASNMFSQIGISKRVKYLSRREDARYLNRVNQLLAAYEYEVLPLSRLLSLRTLRVWVVAGASCSSMLSSSWAARRQDAVSARGRAPGLILIAVEGAWLDVN